MSDTDEVLNQALAAIDVEDADIEAANDKGDGNDKKTEDAGDGKLALDEGDKPAGDKKNDSPEPDDKEEPSDKAAKADGEVEELPEGEFTADDALEVEEAPTPAATDAPVDQAGIILTPAEQKYVVKYIGDPVVLNGYKLDKDGNQEAYQVKAYGSNHLPDDFHFHSEADRAQATTAFNAVEQKANNLLGTFRQDQTKAQAAEYERSENEAIRSDIAELQREGRMPKFRVRPGAPGFDEDPAAQIVAEVEKIMADKNQKYLEDSQKGKAYRHIGFEQAYDIYERTNPARVQAKKVDAAQDAEDKARKGKAEHGDSNRGESPKNIMKATVPQGTTNRDIMAMIDAEEI